MPWSGGADVLTLVLLAVLMLFAFFMLRARRRGAQPSASGHALVDRLHTWAQQVGGRVVTAARRSPAVMDRPEARSITPLAVVDVQIEGRSCQIGVWNRTSSNLASPVRFAYQELVAVIPGAQRTTGAPVFGIGHLDGRARRRGGDRRGAEHASRPPTALIRSKPQFPWGMRGAVLWPAPDIAASPAELADLTQEIARRGAWILLGESDLEIAVPARSVMPEEFAAFAVRVAATLRR